MAQAKPLDLSPFGKVIHRADTIRGRFICRINYPAPIGRKETTFLNVDDANEHLLYEYQRRHLGQGQRRAPITIGELADSWYRRRVRKGLRRKTLAADRAYLDARIIPDWGAWKIDQITPLDVQDWIDRLEREPHLNARNGEPLSEAMVHKYRRALDSVLREGIRQGMITTSAAAEDMVDITLNRVPPREGQVFTDDEVTALWHVIDPRYRAVIALGAYGLGLRVGEWAGLAITDFSPRTRELSIRRKVIEVGGKVHIEDWLKGGNPGRVVTLGIDMTTLWSDHVGRHSRNGWVFPAPAGGVLSPNNFNKRIWKPAVIEIGRPEARFHWLRHTNITRLREEGIDLETASKHAGHVSSKITERVYSHLSPARAEEVAAAQDRLLRRLDR